MEIVKSAVPVRTNARCQMIDITGPIEESLRQSGLSDGIITVYCPHTTAAVTINENADPDVVHDILLTLEQIIPHHRAGYRHTEGNSDAHVKSSIVGCSVQIPFSNDKLSLGTWQAVFFCEFDGPRSRTIQIQITGQ
jgi:secondary thiamine-phosphate synthase enzyme